MKSDNENQNDAEEQGISVWLDDCRPMPPEYDVHVETAEAAIELLKKGNVAVISLDHDLGEGIKTGYDVAKFIEEGAIRGTLGFVRVRLHTASPVGRQNMAAALRNAHKAWNRIS